MTTSYFPTLPIGDVVEEHPGAALRIGGIDRHVRGDRARADRAAQGLPPEVRQGGGIGAVEAQGCDTQTDSGHDFFLPMGSFTAAALDVRRQRRWRISEDGALTCPGGQVWWFPLAGGNASGEGSRAGNPRERPLVSLLNAGAGRGGHEGLPDSA